ncbi:hypothetical protein GCM10023321_44830 [Pseudonocardia eucalypti]|uniref:Uncharacterized protein n=1 Tax=Pseudonocardia eucalypti TaxID=648755 RepID=A0ABP9QFK8_9PSEU|nr:hypothetical protein [Pseudonocardia eucalypti]
MTSSGKVSTRAARERDSTPNRARGPAGSTSRSTVTGAPIAANIGATINSATCCTARIQNSAPAYTPTTPEVSSSNVPSPPTRKLTVRPAGHSGRTPPR